MRDSSLSLRMTGKETSHVLLIKIAQFRFNIEIWKKTVNTQHFIELYSEPSSALIFVSCAGEVRSPFVDGMG
jgi:hypothetical protein